MNKARDSFDLNEKVGPVLSLPNSLSPPKFPGHLQKLVTKGATGFQKNRIVSAVVILEISKSHR